MGLCAINVMKNTVKPNKQFMENFRLCMEYYEVEMDEAKFERDRCLKNMNDAERCYSVIAYGIRKENEKNKRTNT